MKISDLKGKKILVLGLSTTGFAAAKFLLRAGADCYLSDSNALSDENKPKAEVLKKAGAKLEFGGHSTDFIKNAEFCVLSPSIPPNAEVLKLLDEFKIPYFSDIELAWRIKPEKTKIVAITGTNGKTTTTMLVSQKKRKKYLAPAAGNVGVSPLDYLCTAANSGISLDVMSEIKAMSDIEPDFLVIEASSYQLHYAKDFAPDVAIFCNLTPDHLSWHGGIQKYFEDKAKMYKNMGKSAHGVLNFDDERVCRIETAADKHYFALNDAMLGAKKPEFKPGLNDSYIKDGKIYYGATPVIDVKDVPIVGAHNLQNVMCAVIAAKAAGLDNDIIKAGIMSFKAPRHRCEFILELNGVSYYNDSKATNPEASNVAIGAFNGKRVVLIAGGRDKNTPLDEFCALIKKHIEKVVLIGEAAQRFKEALDDAGFNNIAFSKTLEGAIDEAESEKPDVVLFSPACASFDMFKNYEVRGDAFRDYVLSKKSGVRR